MGSVMNNYLNRQSTQLVIGTQAATASVPGMYFAQKSRIKALSLIDGAGVVADNTNFLQVSVQTLAAVVLAAHDTRAAHEGALTALTPKALVISGSALLASDNSGELEIPAGTTIKIVATKNGTGVPTNAVVVMVPALSINTPAPGQLGAGFLSRRVHGFDDVPAPLRRSQEAGSRKEKEKEKEGGR